MGKTALQTEGILNVFYMAVRLINAKRGRKYVNVGMFLRFFSPEECQEYLTEIKDNLASKDLVNL
jgi:uncharacterized SAM-dependent methyltransferase